MGDDDEYICAACGRQMQNHGLIVRDDGVIVAGSIIDPYGDWTICCDLEREPEPRAALEYDYP